VEKKEESGTMLAQSKGPAGERKSSARGDREEKTGTIQKNRLAQEDEAAKRRQLSQLILHAINENDEKKREVTSVSFHHKEEGGIRKRHRCRPQERKNRQDQSGEQDDLVKGDLYVSKRKIERNS